MFLDRKVLASVIGIGIKGDDEPCGTGFGLSYPMDGDRNSPVERHTFYIVTCKHVVEDIQASAPKNDPFYELRFRDSATSEISRTWLPFEFDAWTFHGSSDAAVIPIKIDYLDELGIGVGWISTGTETLTKSDILDDASGVGFEGTGVYMVGFPEGWQPGSIDWPVVRSGVIGQISGWLYGEHPEFLVAGPAWGGNSGGPVVTIAERSFLPVPANVSRRYKNLLVGMISGRKIPALPENEETEVLNEIANLDLTVAIPVDVIEETIELDRRRRGAEC